MGILKLLQASYKELECARKNAYDHVRGFLRSDLEHKVLDSNRPVIAIHGYFQYNHAFDHMRSVFRMHNRTVIPVGYGPFTQDIRKSADQVAEYIYDIQQYIGTDKVDVVGHSMGGVVAHYMLKNLNGEQYINKMCALGSPLQGTYAAYIGYGASAKQMRPGSKLLTTLNNTILPANVQTPISLYSEIDPLIIPTHNARASDFRNIPMHGVMHAGLIYLRRPLRRLLKELS